MFSNLIRSLAFSTVFLVGLETTVAQFEFDEPPISYTDTDAEDEIAKLIKKMESEDVQLAWDKRRGWLPDLLEKLNVDPETQSLVFSKTSMQIRHITPKNPRAVYFSDDIYVGYVPGGELIELSAVDPELGAVFYTIEQKETDRPRITRDESQCMTCHGTSKTQNVPGYVTRSVFASGSGHPHYSLGTTTTSHETPFRKRFGGWYVTGNHGELRHRGNVIARNDPVRPIDAEAGANQSDLPESVRRENYMTDTSDVVAIMVLEHQSQMHNMMTHASYETRQALHYQKTLNKALERPDDFQSESTQRRIASAGNKLLSYMLFRDEYMLTATVTGNSDFATGFSKQAVRDQKGRSLRDFDLSERLFKLPCSFLIHSESFDRLPDPVRKFVLNKLFEGLNAPVAPKEFDHLRDDQRRAILEILIETKPEIAELAASKNQD